MESLAHHHLSKGAILADDGIPQQFGEPAAEYAAALTGAALFDRSHEARLRLDGDDRYPFLQRISTNDVLKLRAGTGCATIFTNPNGRVIDRIEVYAGESYTMLTGGPGRAEPLLRYLQRNIFFRDKVKVSDMTAATRQFALHGPLAAELIEKIAPGTRLLPLHSYHAAEIAGTQVMIARAKPISGDHFRLIMAGDGAIGVWDALKALGTVPAGSQTYNVLRIRASLPAAGRELSEDYIPLELGLWDEVSFAKGCYTGQEIIARMESRGKLAKTLVSVQLDSAADSPIDILIDGKRAGTLTSTATAPDGIHYAIGLLKPDLAVPGTRAVTAAGVGLVVTGLPGAQPPG